MNKSMKKKMKTILAIGLILIATTLLGNASITDIKTTKPILKSSTVQPNENATLTESEAYKMLYENQLESNNSILNTILYALGGLGTAILFVFASNWWFNEKKVKELTKGINSQINEAKNEALKEVRERVNSFSNEKTKEINNAQNKLQAEVTTAITVLTKEVTDYKDKIRNEIKGDNKNLSDNYQKQLDTLNEIYTQQISSLNEGISSVSSNLKETINNKEELLKEIINTETESILSKLDSLKENIHRNEFWMWEGRGVPNNAIRAQLRELEIKLKSNSDLTFYLNQILETSKKLKWLEEFEKANIKQTLRIVPEKYKLLVGEIYAITDSLPGFAV